MTKNNLKKSYVTFVNSPKLLANYYCFLAKHLQNGFYQKQNFIILPYLSSCFQSVYFPDLNLNPSFWRRIKNYPHSSLVKSFPQKAIEHVVPKFLPVASCRYGENLPTDLYDQPLIASQLKKISSITVLPTQFGTKSSFHFQKRSGKYQVFMTLRSDQPLETINQSLVNIALLIKNPRFGYELFDERHAIVDFLTNSKKERGSSSQELLDKSAYLARLGFGEKPTVIIRRGEILINNKLARRHLSVREYLVINNFFIKKSLSTDEISDLFWPNQPEKYSQWAVTKAIQRLRKKIEDLEVNKEIIHTLRGRGYILG